MTACMIQGFTENISVLMELFDDLPENLVDALHDAHPIAQS